MSEPKTEAEQPLQYAEDRPQPAEDAPGEPGELVADPRGPEPSKGPQGPAKPERDVFAPTSGGAPSWVTLPAELRFPKNRQKLFFRFPSRWTFSPGVGVPLNRVETDAERAQSGESGLWRQVIVWPNSGGDVKLAIGRAQGDQNRLTIEMTKQMIRAIDGHVVTWSGELGPGNVDEFWEQVGAPCQTLIRQLWNQLHSLDRNKLTVFLESYVEVKV